MPGNSVTSLNIRQFTHYFKTHLTFNPSPTHAHNEDYIVLFTRKHNRVILNELELSIALAKEYNMKVYTVGAEDYKIIDIIALLQSAQVLVGMHGSLLVLSMFLSPGAVLVELFPYAVVPENYTPYKTLAELYGMGLVYRSWRVTNEQHTVTHPDHPRDTGGIRHLPVEHQKLIESSAEVPPHLCCRDPEWLFRIYQDSKVDVQALFTVINSAIHQRNRLLQSNSDLYLYLPYKHYPTVVQHMICVGSGDVLVSETQDGTLGYRTMDAYRPALKLNWDAPWNVRYMNVSAISYEVWIQDTGSDNYSAWILTRTEHRFTLGLKPHKHYSIWVRCIVDDHVLGPFNQDHITCTT